MDFRKRIGGTYDSLFGEGIKDNDFGGRSQFAAKWGWYQSIVHLANGDVTKLDEVTGTNVHQCLRKLSFDKEKAEIEAQELKRQRQ